VSSGGSFLVSLDRIDGNALLSAVRYELEKLRCSACGEVFTAPARPAPTNTAPCQGGDRPGTLLPGIAVLPTGTVPSPGRVPVADATQWELAEQVADCAYPAFEQLEQLAAQGEVIFQDDTHVRILALLAENQRADATGAPLERRGCTPPAWWCRSANASSACITRAGRTRAIT